MPLYNLKCPACKYELDDVLCTYVEAQSKKCTKCEKAVMDIVPNTAPVLVWNCDTDFSHSRKNTKE